MGRKGMVEARDVIRRRGLSRLEKLSAKAGQTTLGSRPPLISISCPNLYCHRQLIQPKSAFDEH